MLGLRRWRGGAAPRSAAAAETLPTLVLEEALEALAWRPDPQVLDLGPAVTANVELLASVPARVHVADLYTALRAAAARASTVDWDALLPPDQRFDLILTWDLLNYLTPEEIPALGRALERRCRPGGQVLAWISIRDPLPPRPGRYELLDRSTVRRVADPKAANAAPRPSPRYREPQLLRWLEGFTVHKAFLLRHGVQEYLFTLPTNPPETP